MNSLPNLNPANTSGSSSRSPSQQLPRFRSVLLRIFHKVLQLPKATSRWVEQVYCSQLQSDTAIIMSCSEMLFRIRKHLRVAECFNQVHTQDKLWLDMVTINWRKHNGEGGAALASKLSCFGSNQAGMWSHLQHGLCDVHIMQRQILDFRNHAQKLL